MKSESASHLSPQLSDPLPKCIRWAGFLASGLEIFRALVNKYKCLLPPVTPAFATTGNTFLILFLLSCVSFCEFSIFFSNDHVFVKKQMKKWAGYTSWKSEARGAPTDEGLGGV